MFEKLAASKVVLLNLNPGPPGCKNQSSRPPRYISPSELPLAGPSSDSLSPNRQRDSAPRHPHPSALTVPCAHPRRILPQTRLTWQRQLTYLNEPLCSFTAFLERKAIFAGTQTSPHPLAIGAINVSLATPLTWKLSSFYPPLFSA